MNNLNFVNYASGNHIKYQKINNSYINFFCKPNKIFSYNENILKLQHEEFYNKNQITLSQKRGGGYWLWKPYIILDALKKIKNDDYLIYYDSGIGLRYRVWTSCSHYIKWIEDNNCSFIPGIFIPERGDHHRWCKPSVIDAIIQDEATKKNNLPQIQATFSIWKKNQESIDFLVEWLYWCEQEHFIDDFMTHEDHKRRNEYIEHRHDQSILTCLCLQKKIKTINDSSQFIEYNKSLSFVELSIINKMSLNHVFYKMLLLVLKIKNDKKTKPFGEKND